MIAAVAGAWLATWLQRYVTIVGTAFGGAWAMLVGALALIGDKAQAGRRRRRRRVGALSDASGARAGVGAVGVAGARRRSACWCSSTSPAARAAGCEGRKKT